MNEPTPAAPPAAAPPPLIISVCKADPVSMGGTVGAILQITEDLPRSGILAGDEPTWRRKAICQFGADAHRVMQALLALPQGTLDQLLMLMLENRASLLRVPVRPAPLNLQLGDPPNALRMAVAILLEEATRDRPGLAPVSITSASQAIWFALRTAEREDDEEPSPAPPPEAPAEAPPALRAAVSDLIQRLALGEHVPQAEAVSLILAALRSEGRDISPARAVEIARRAADVEGESHA